MAYNWTDDLATGNAVIDQQHKQLIQAFNDFLEACNRGAGDASLEKTMTFLVDYTVRHFRAEEQLQRQYGYPQYTQHKKLHEQFQVVVGDIVSQLKQAGPTVLLVTKASTTIGGWLRNHIKTEDKKVADHIRTATS